MKINNGLPEDIIDVRRWSIYPHRHQNLRAVRTVPLPGSIDLTSDPGALHRLGREHQQEVVVAIYRVEDGRLEALARPQRAIVAPDTHAAPAQPSVQTRDEWGIAMRIADEA